NLRDVLIRDTGGCSGDFDPSRAEQLVDDWFRDHEGDEVLREICCHLGVSAYGREGQRRAVKRALRQRKVRADRRTGGVAIGGSPKEDTRPPLPVGRPAYEPAREKAAIRFRLVESDTFKPLVGVAAFIEFPDGSRKEMVTDGAGELYFAAPAGTNYKIVEIRAPFALAGVQPNG